MSRRNTDSIDYLDDLDDVAHLSNVKLQVKGKQLNQQKARSGRKAKASRPAASSPELGEQPAGEEGVSFTYRASRHEREWILGSLSNFYDQQWLADVLRLVKGGKEANVYLCAADAATTDADYLAAKIYRPRRFRNLKNDVMYREGRSNLDSDGNVILDGGQMHAIRKKTGYGLQLLHTSWIEHEFKALKLLHAAGADVPLPYARGDNAILMEYVGGEEMPAPTLNDVELDPDEAALLLPRILHNVELMLANGWVHGDLSAYNILYWEGEITLIDFPQVVTPRSNPHAYKIFERDMIRICEYFGRFGVQARPRNLAAEMWTAYRYRRGPEVHPRYLDDSDEKDLEYWHRLQSE